MRAHLRGQTESEPIGSYQTHLSVVVLRMAQLRPLFPKWQKFFLLWPLLTHDQIDQQPVAEIRPRRHRKQSRRQPLPDTTSKGYWRQP